jgi:hypothetical protein
MSEHIEESLRIPYRSPSGDPGIGEQVNVYYTACIARETYDMWDSRKYNHGVRGK